MPTLNCVASPIDLPHVTIAQSFGHSDAHPAAAGPPPVSVATVVGKADAVEDWQTPDFDEWLVVLEGELTIESSHDAPVVATAGQTVYIPRGERTRACFKVGSKYVAVCSPAFHPTLAHREEGSSADAAKCAPPPHDKHTDVYHLVQKPLWEEVTWGGKKVYFPPTYEQDGFTHATSGPEYLIGVANHFYKSSDAEWLCLKMTRATIKAAGVTLKYEWPSPVGKTRPLDGQQSGGERFPHLFGGITTDMVVGVVPVKRAADGEFLAIEGLA